MRKICSLAMILISTIIVGASGAQAQTIPAETMCFTQPGPAGPSLPGILLSVNGTLMRGLKLAQSNMIGTGSTFVADVLTVPAYDLYAINEDHPAMFRGKGTVAVVGEVWCVPFASAAVILAREPAGLAIGKVELVKPVVASAPDRTTRSWTTVLGVIGEEISLKEANSALAIGERYNGSFRAYVSSRGMDLIDDFLRAHPDVSPSVRDQVLIYRRKGESLHRQGMSALVSTPPDPSASASSFIQSIDSFHHAIVLLGIRHTLYPLPPNSDGTCSEPSKKCMPFINQ
ncbi:MAG TPA: hypothetical protein VGZ00_00645 [Candidatus Baltobacteraceae bacterium]|jgi:hypothetical protein|nr:hypothetical protein [Candidatus Baltobacteraceae bacterium]